MSHGDKVTQCLGSGKIGRIWRFMQFCRFVDNWVELSSWDSIGWLKVLSRSGHGGVDLGCW